MLVNSDSIIIKLLESGVIRKTGVRGWYYRIDKGAMKFRRPQLLDTFATQYGVERYSLNSALVSQMVTEARNTYTREALAQWFSNGTPLSLDERLAPVNNRPLRTLTRGSYHSNGGGANRPGIEEALAAIPYDADGVRRSYGVEYEIYSLTAQQEDKLVGILETLPKHVCERDGSLGNNGVEIVFLPVGAEDYIRIVKTLGQFVRENRVKMQDDEEHQAGMHTTYGVSNYEASKDDLQIRLNRIALAVKSVGTQQAIKALFGRDFGHYRELPRGDGRALLYNAHGNAFSTNGRPRNCWECRLLDYRCNPEKVVEFFKATEIVFHRPVDKPDFIEVFDLLGGATE